MAKKNHKSDKETVALRREIEALRVQLKEQGVKSVVKSDKLGNGQYDLKQIKQQVISSSQGKNKVTEENYVIASDYLGKELGKTMLLSFFAITAIIVIKVFNLI